MRWIVMAALAVLAFAPQAGAQEATAEIEVIVWGHIAHLTHNCPLDDRGRIQSYDRMTVICTLRALDADSLSTPATFTAEIIGPAGRVTTRVADSTLTMTLLTRTGIPGVRVVLTARPVVWSAGGGR